MTLRALAALALLPACAPRIAPRAAMSMPRAAPVIDRASRAAALQALAASMVGDEPAQRDRARAIGLVLRDAGGARTLTGEGAADDAVREATVLTSLDSVGAVLVTSRCGNAWVVALRWDGAWRAGSVRALVDGARPGACLLTSVRAEAAAISTRALREILVAWRAEAEDGDSERVTTFSALRLDDAGRCDDLTGPVALGGEDDATGAAREGSWFVDDVLPPPRDVVLEVRPSRPGPGGQGVAQIERQVWRYAGARMVRVESVTEPVAQRREFAPPR